MICGAGEPGQVLGSLVPDVGGEELPGQALPQPLGRHGVRLVPAQPAPVDVDQGLPSPWISLQSVINQVIRRQVSQVIRRSGDQVASESGRKALIPSP